MNAEHQCQIERDAIDYANQVFKDKSDHGELGNGYSWNDVVKAYVSGSEINIKPILTLFGNWIAANYKMEGLEFNTRAGLINPSRKIEISEIVDSFING